MGACRYIWIRIFLHSELLVSPSRWDTWSVIMAYSKAETQESLMDSRSSDDMNTYCRCEAYSNPVCGPCHSGIWFKYNHSRWETEKHEPSRGSRSAVCMFITEFSFLIICILIYFQYFHPQALIDSILLRTKCPEVPTTIIRWAQLCGDVQSACVIVPCENELVWHLFSLSLPSLHHAIPSSAAEHQNSPGRHLRYASQIIEGRWIAAWEPSDRRHSLHVSSNICRRGKSVTVSVAAVAQPWCMLLCVMPLLLKILFLHCL